MTAFDQEAWLAEVRAGDDPRPEPATIDDLLIEVRRIADALEAQVRAKVCGEMHTAGKPCILDDRHVGHHATSDGRLHWLDEE